MRTNIESRYSIGSVCYTDRDMKNERAQELGRELAALRVDVLKTCAVCGKEFMGLKRRGAAFCSNKCKQAGWRQSKMAKTIQSPPTED